MAARRAAHSDPTILRVFLFGSLVEGIPTPRSDADLLVEVSESPFDSPRDRIPDLLHLLAPLPCPLDLFVFTSDEVLRLQETPLIRTALRSGVDLLDY